MTLDHLGCSLFDCRYMVTVPSGAKVGFIDERTFQGYVKVWRDSGFELEFDSDCDCTIKRGAKTPARSAALTLGQFK